MKIDLGEVHTLTKFGCIDEGEAFKSNGIYWMKTEYLRYEDDEFDYFLNAINLKTGEIGRFFDTAEVEPIKFKLVLDK